MKIGVALDGVLCDTNSLREEWFKREGDLKFLNDTGFWGVVPAYDDVRGFGEYVLKHSWDLYVLAQRPKAVSLTTRSWLRNHAGLKLDKEHLVMQAIKRFDCRILGIDVLIDSDIEAIENLKRETVRPIRSYFVDRAQGASLLETAEQINESIRNRS